MSASLASVVDVIVRMINWFQ